MFNSNAKSINMENKQQGNRNYWNSASQAFGNQELD
jgi:hypothetical protein